MNSRPGILFSTSQTDLPADGNWTLTLTDLSPGGTMTLNSWSIQVVGVPEPSSTVLVLGGLAGFAAARRKWFARRG